MTPEITMIPVVYAVEFGQEVEDFCDECSISTHYQDGLYHLDLDGNPLQEFFEQGGHIFPDVEQVMIGVIGT